MKTQTPMLFRAMKWALGLLAAGAMFAMATAEGDPSLASPMTRIQRRAEAEVATAQNAVGELTYHVDTSHPAAVLRVGTSDSGTVIVGDPYAIHVAPRRKLDAGEFGIVVTGSYTANADGSILLATNVVSGVATNTVTIRPIDPAVKIASVAFDLAALGAGRQKEVTEDRATLVVHTSQEDYPDPVGRVPGWAVLRGVTVWVWAGDRRDETWDTTTADLQIIDSMGSVAMSGIRRWVADRYDGRTGEEWSLYPANHRVNLAGQTVYWSSGGALRSQVDSGSWSYYASGVPVLRVVSGVDGESRTEDLAILAITMDSANDLVQIDVNAALGVPVYIDSCNDLTVSDWFRAAGQTSTYPQTVSVGGIPAYRVTVPIDPSAAAAFYRATATIGDGGAENRALHLGGVSTDLYIAGERCAWTNIVVNGASLRVLVAQPD